MKQLMRMSALFPHFKNSVSPSSFCLQHDSSLFCFPQKISAFLNTSSKKHFYYTSLKLLCTLTKKATSVSNSFSDFSSSNVKFAFDQKCFPFPTFNDFRKRQVHKAWFSSASSSPLPLKPHSTVNESNVFDCFIVGGGVTGTALLYVLATFTDLKRLALVERRDEFAIVASSAKNNSQTIHCGDIETNYTLEKAKKVKIQADMLRNYATKLPDDMKNSCIARYPKMVLGVGREECESLKKRFEIFRDTFSNMSLIGKEEIARLEPMVGMKDRFTYREEEICAISILNEHSTIDYHQLSKFFVKYAKLEQDNKKVSIYMQTEVKEIQHVEPNMFRIKTDKGVVYSRFVVVSACGNSLQLAQRMGYAKQYSCLPVAGSFYFTNKNVLNGKVYTIQNPALPFAAVHGDPDIVAKGKTRFGPTALPLPMLERYNISSIKDFLEVLNPDMNLLKVYLNLLKVSTLRNYMLKNVLYEVPYLNKRLFLQDVRKIIPSLRVEDIEYANGYGGVRPQLVDKENCKLLLGEGKIKPDNENIIFNITPSPGATTCLGNAKDDMLTICKKLNANFNEKKFSEILLQGEYPVS